MAVTKDDGVPFDINLVGESSGTTWVGSFRAKEKLSFRDQMQIDRFRRELIGPNPQGMDGEVSAVITMIAELSVRVTEAPAWWTESRGGLDLVDANLLMDVYGKAMDAQNKALDRLKKAGEGAKKDLRDIRDREDKKK